MTSVVSLLIASTVRPATSTDSRFKAYAKSMRPPPSSFDGIVGVPAQPGLSTPTSITFHKPRSPPQMSPLEVAFDSTFGFVSSEEASEAACRSLPGLTNHQRHLCRQNPGLIWAVVDGTQLGLYECVHQFRHERWNCSMARIVFGSGSSNEFHLPPTGSAAAANILGGLQDGLSKGTRETAFMTAAWAAGAVQAITRACSRGRIGTCDCDSARRGGKSADAEGEFTWGGCSDPIKFGMKLTRLFQEARVPSKRRGRRGSQNATHFDEHTIARVSMDSHNRNVGRRTSVECSRVDTTCFSSNLHHTVEARFLQRFSALSRRVGDLLKKAYAEALHVSFDAKTRHLRRVAEPLYFGGMPLPSHLAKRSTSTTWQKPTNWFIVGSGQRNKRGALHGAKWIRQQRDKLVYLESSQDYCKADHRIGHLGVAGRQCDVAEPNHPNSCDKICCGFGYDTAVVDTKEKCGCRFVWCCEVKCNICHRKTRIHRCRPDSTPLERQINEILNSSSISAWMGRRRKSHSGY
ncbi:unnamed protein product [Mesocestoides corti]|uniref:Protein Wnt n=1 Tax=Mesocestoides corti TaxID=53468 RepID=A0A3P6GNA5_MESCO|nr:unnamed protein product [Mesocestoides corti]